MGKKEDNFGVGSLVFARLKGYPPWPAKIVKAEKKRYYVYFYGTGEKSPAMKMEDLYDYSKHKVAFVVDKNLKRKFYPEAVDQIEAVLRGEEDIASINNTSAVDEEPNPIDEDVAQMAELVNETEAVVVKVKDETDDGEMPELTPEIPLPPVKETKTAKKSVSKTQKLTPVPDQKPPKLEPETSEPEIVSRSGRKIKSKRYLIDEIEETVTPTIKKRVVEDTGSPKVKAIAVKDEPENPEKETFLEIEDKLLNLDRLIKASVPITLEDTDVDKCLEYLHEYNALKITPLMLKKRPGVVYTIKRLRKYVGNVNKWEMDDTSKLDFEKKAHKIQLKAEEIYSKFKSMFQFTGQIRFWDFFQTKVQDFQTKTCGLTEKELNEIYQEPATPPNSPDKTNNGSVSQE